MSIESLKEQARRHEQKEEWLKALDQYKKAIAKLAEDDQPDIGLYNRVGDLFVRVGDLGQAVEHYEQAVDLYIEAYLPNNAIAVCKKIIRNVPDRHKAYLKIGQIRGEQGFLPDARTNFLTYAERMQQDGDLDESFRALVEFCDLAPDEVDVRIIVADQMASHDRKDDAVAQLSVAHQRLLANGDHAQASAVADKIRELDPSIELEAAVGAGDPMAGYGDIDITAGEAAEGSSFDISSGESDDDGGVEIPDFEIASADDAADQPEDQESEVAVELPTFDIGDEDEVEPGELPAFEIGGEDEVAALPTLSLDDDSDDAAVELPTFDIGDDEAADDPSPLPTLDVDDAAPEEELDESSVVGMAELPTLEVAEDAGALQTFDMGGDEDGGADLPMYYPDEDEDAPIAVEAAEGATVSEAARTNAVEDALESSPASEDAPTLDDVRARIAASPDDVALRQRMVEMAYGTGDDSVLADAYLGLAQALDRSGENARAQAAYQQVLQADPGNVAAQTAVSGGATAAPVREVAANEDYIDLGSLIFGDEEEKTTRFVVAYDEPSGDEAADFAKMLSQFKEKVSENLDADDVKAHHDLGTAYMEMGLLDEAISEFQAALRASPDHLATYELMGQTFMEMGKPEAAVKSLERALEVDHEIEDELVGIYYYLARAYESLENNGAAVDFYDRVFSLDINFADVTERLRTLRQN